MKIQITFLICMILTFALVFINGAVSAQSPDVNAMSKEERDAYFAKLREASVEDHKQMMDLLNIDSIR